jgi:hypothetical protein
LFLADLFSGYPPPLFFQGGQATRFGGLFTLFLFGGQSGLFGFQGRLLLLASLFGGHSPPFFFQGGEATRFGGLFTLFLFGHPPGFGQLGLACEFSLG